MVNGGLGGCEVGGWGETNILKVKQQTKKVQKVKTRNRDYKERRGAGEAGGMFRLGVYN